MKGIIFNLLERAVVEEHGEDVWDDLLDQVGSDGVYSAVGQYDDEHLMAFVSAAAEMLGADEDSVVRWFGVSAIPLLADTYPAFFTDAGDLRTFLTSLNDVIHSEVRKIYPGAVVPEFAFQHTDTGGLVMHYRSPRSLCQLAIGFATGASQHFGEPVAIVEEHCKRDGHEECVLHVDFLDAA